MSLRDKLEKMDNRLLYLNLFFTQLILLLLGNMLYIFFLKGKMSLAQLFHLHKLGTYLLAGLIFAFFVLVIDIILMKLFPKGYFDDGGVNERIFRDINVFQIALIALGVALVEEWLFRGVLQNLIGLFWTSLVFSAIHYRYFGRFFYALLIISISFGFGFLYQWTDSLWSVIFAHFIIDFCLGIIIRYRLLTNGEDM